MMKTAKKTIYFTSELNDEFSGIKKKTVQIPENFKFVHKNPLWRFLSFIVYRVIMTPFAFIYCKLALSLKIHGREKLSQAAGSGCFMYGNHTLTFGDAFIPTLAVFPRRAYVIVHPDNISTPGTKNFILMSGAIPIPPSITAFRGFMNAIEKRTLQNHCVTVYPEAHIWPYYTGIRPFPSTSFRYPVKFDVPVFCRTATFQKKKNSDKPRVTVYIDGPFWRDKSLSAKKAEEKLHSQVYQTMCRRAADHNTYSPVEYIKKEETTQ